MSKGAQSTRMRYKAVSLLLCSMSTGSLTAIDGTGRCPDTAATPTGRPRDNGPQRSPQRRDGKLRARTRSARIRRCTGAAFAKAACAPALGRSLLLSAAAVECFLNRGSNRAALCSDIPVPIEEQHFAQTSFHWALFPEHWACFALFPRYFFGVAFSTSPIIISQLLGLWRHHRAAAGTVARTAQLQLRTEVEGQPPCHTHTHTRRVATVKTMPHDVAAA